ncbi:hypothetical protein ACQP25_08475 [Microtetraspora malaysiensis]|uniref:hypothetical protein n=1 Tax=Microtetraspora malaysiensis TaxID=161358 RepID=UPI003D8C0AD7
MAERHGSNTNKIRIRSGRQSPGAAVVNLRAVQLVDQRSAQSGTTFCQPVDGVDDLSPGPRIQCVEPGEELVGGADLPLLHNFAV